MERKKEGGMLLGRKRESVNREKEREGGVSGEKERKKGRESASGEIE